MTEDTLSLKDVQTRLEVAGWKVVGTTTDEHLEMSHAGIELPMTIELHPNLAAPFKATWEFQVPEKTYKAYIDYGERQTTLLEILEEYAGQVDQYTYRGVVGALIAVFRDVYMKDPSANQLLPLRLKGDWGS